MLLEMLKEEVEGSESPSGLRGHLPGRPVKLKVGIGVPWACGPTMVAERG